MNSFRSGLADPLPALSDRIGGILELPVFFSAAAGASGTWTAPRDGTLLIYLWGGGGGGNYYDSGGTPYGGGGGAALFKRVKIQKGQAVPYAVGVGGDRLRTGSFAGIAGGETTATLPNGIVLRASGGAGGGAVINRSAAGGIAANGDLNRAGGQGSYSTSSAATAGEFGGAPGSAGGGGAGGFTDLPFLIKPGAGRREDQQDIGGVAGAYVAFPGGGGFGAKLTNYDTKGGHGALFFILE